MMNKHTEKQEYVLQIVLRTFLWYGFKKTSMDDIAKAAGVSRRECFRCFKELRGESPTVFLTQYRLSIAATQLATTGLPISAIAENCGFESSGYFSRLFKARYGKTPREFRK